MILTNGLFLLGAGELPVLGAVYDMAMVYRGIGGCMENMVFQETGYILSNEALAWYFESQNIEIAMSGVNQTHYEWIRIWWSSKTDYAGAHTLFGTELGEMGMNRTFISVTTDPGIAKTFAGSGGTIYSGWVPRSNLVSTPIYGSESEMLLRGGTNLLKPIKN